MRDNKHVKHTPGPWVTARAYRAVYPERGEPGSICDVHSWMGIEEADANQRLIAAAPELLEACRELLDIAQCRPMTLEQQADKITVARISIAKAEGRE